MGQLVIVYAKKDANLAKLNMALWKANIDNSFVTENDNIAWLEDINTNPDSHNAHLKPADRDLTMEELIRTFGIYATVGAMNFDVAFSRTTDKEAIKYAAFIKKHAKQLEAIRGGEELIKRYQLAAPEVKAIKAITIQEKEPEMLPKEEQTKKDLQSGLLLCKSWGLEPFWVVFGNVERPVFMKEKKYKDDLYNNLYRDKQGRAYMLLPLMPLGTGEKVLDFVEKVYNAATEIGLREHPNFFLSVVYGLSPANYKETTEAFQNYYTGEERKERFWSLFKMTDSVFHYGSWNGFRWSDMKHRFEPCSETANLSSLAAKCAVLTCLLHSLGAEAAAELMSNLTGKPYKKFEFELR